MLPRYAAWIIICASLACVLQSVEECAAIKEKVKKYIAERNALEGMAGSGSGYTEAPPTLAAEVPDGENAGTPKENMARDGVDNKE